MNDDDETTPSRIDLTAVDPTRDGARFDAIVRSIAVQAMAERAREREGLWALLTPVVAWTRPMLAAAAVILIVAGSALVAVPAPAVAAPGSLAESAGVPAVLVDLATNGRAVTASELVDAFDSMAVSSRGH
jgi:hypothetical protein